MDWDDEYYDGCDGMNYAAHRQESLLDKSVEGGLNPMDITNPVSAYFFLSDDAQDEISGSDGKKMKCVSCGHRFMGETYDSCPECFTFDTEEAVDEKDDGY